MKLHYKGKYNLNPESLPHGEHMPGAVKFKEADSTKQMGWILTIWSMVIAVIAAVPAVIRRDMLKIEAHKNRLITKYCYLRKIGFFFL